MAIAEGRAAFSVAVFDVNSLKEINDRLGHERGDEVICAAARVIAKVFGAEYTYRIGGDEFAAICESISEGDMAAVDAEIAASNAASNTVGALSLSKGVSHYRPNADISFKEVFTRADVAMYQNKKTYYEEQENRRMR
jgi:diguanylate cyclase (GGDEF)-like protein